MPQVLSPRQDRGATAITAPLNPLHEVQSTKDQVLEATRNLKTSQSPEQQQQLSSKTKAAKSKIQPSSSSLHIVAKKRPPPMNIGFNELGIDSKRQVLYRNFHQVDNHIYLIEISRNSKKVFTLMFPNFEKPEDYLSETLTEKQAMRLMNESGNVFENFVKTFYVKFNKLQIRGHHGKGAYTSNDRNQTVSPKRARLAYQSFHDADGSGDKNNKEQAGYSGNEPYKEIQPLNENDSLQGFSKDNSQYVRDTPTPPPNFLSSNTS